MIRHVVLFRLRRDAGNDAVKLLMTTLRSFAAIDGVIGVVVGRNVTTRSDFDVAFTCDFQSRDSLDSYLDDPVHVRAVREILPRVVDTGWVVVDIETGAL